MSLTSGSLSSSSSGPEAEQFVDQHLFQRELLAPVEVDLQLGEHLADDRAEFLGQLVLGERRRGFGIDALEQARKHLLLDPVDRGFEAFDCCRLALLAGLRLAVGEPGHRVAAVDARRIAGWRARPAGRAHPARAAGIARRPRPARTGPPGPSSAAAAPKLGRPPPPFAPLRRPNALMSREPRSLRLPLSVSAR